MRLRSSNRCSIQRLWGLLIGVIICAGSVHFTDVRAGDLDGDAGYWTTTSVSAALANRWRAGFLVQTRTLNDFGDLERTVVRPSLSYKLLNNMWLTSGYDAHFIELLRDRLEHRAWQQWQAKWTRSPVSLSTRLRLEERFIEGVDGTAYRLRLQVSADLPVIGTEWNATFSNEYFVGLNDVAGGPDKGFDQNRAYLGFARPLTDKISFSLGYQAQLINRSGTDDLLVHQVMSGISFRH